MRKKWLDRLKKWYFKTRYASLRRNYKAWNSYPNKIIISYTNMDAARHMEVNFHIESPGVETGNSANPESMLFAVDTVRNVVQHLAAKHVEADSFVNEIKKDLNDTPPFTVE